MLAAIGGQEWILILLIALVLFGGKRLPELARSLGKSVNEFKKGMSAIDEEIQKPAETPKNIEPPKQA